MSSAARDRGPQALTAPHLVLVQAVRAQRSLVVRAESTTEGSSVDAEKLIKDLQDKVGARGSACPGLPPPPAAAQLAASPGAWR